MISLGRRSPLDMWPAMEQNICVWSVTVLTDLQGVRKIVHRGPPPPSKPIVRQLEHL